MRLSRVLAALAALITLAINAPASAAAKDAVLNKAGFWGIDVDNGACAASMALKDGSILLFRAVQGDINLAFFARDKLPRGKTARIETEAYGFDFKPAYGEKGDGIFSPDALSAGTVAALRLAREVRILADGRLVVAVNFEGTGFEEALDGVIACSNGKSGWWGKGVQVADAADVEPKGRTATSADDLWEMTVGPSPGVCIAQSGVGDTTAIQFLAAVGRVGFAVNSTEALPRGAKARVETDSYAFDFKTSYGDKAYLASDDPFDSQALFALRRAKWMRVKVGRKVLVDVALDDAGLPQLLDSVAACSLGEKGWWGEGASKP